MSSSSATEHLNQTHKAQVLAYLRFFQSKREEEAKEIDAVFEEQRDMRSEHTTQAQARTPCGTSASGRK